MGQSGGTIVEPSVELRLDEPALPFRYVMDGGGGEHVRLSAGLQLRSAERAQRLRQWERDRLRQRKGDWTMTTPVTPLRVRIELTDEQGHEAQQPIQTRTVGSADGLVRLALWLYTPPLGPFGTASGRWAAAIALDLAPLADVLELPWTGWLRSPTVAITALAVPLEKASFQERLRSLRPGTGRVQVERILGSPQVIFDTDHVPPDKGLANFIRRHQAIVYVYQDPRGRQESIVFDRHRRFAPSLQWAGPTEG